MARMSPAATRSRSPVGSSATRMVGSVIKAQSTTELVYAVEKFTIPDSKLLNLEMFEHHGGRNFKLFIKNKDIVNAALLP